MVGRVETGGGRSSSPFMMSDLEYDGDDDDVVVGELMSLATRPSPNKDKDTTSVTASSKGREKRRLFADPQEEEVDDVEELQDLDNRPFGTTTPTATNGARANKRQRTTSSSATPSSGEPSRPIVVNFSSRTTVSSSSDDATPGTSTGGPTVVKYRRVLKNIPTDVPYVPITTENGSRVYLRLLEKKKKKKNTNNQGRGGGYRLGGELDFDEDSDDDEDAPVKLLSTKDGSNRKLFPNWDQMKRDAAVLKDNFHQKLAAIVDEENVIETLGRSRNQEKDNNNNDALWVEKYKPKVYFDLLSEESTNKSLLQWIKLWDKKVFGNDYLAKVKLIKEKYAALEAKDKEKQERKQWYRHKGGYNASERMDTNNKGKGNAGAASAAEEEEEYDDTGRPKVKVALLHGPPGLGKTTCAHIVAKQAGYSVREMNASDDRSVDAFKKALDNALQSRTETFKEGKPNCLIIDEIDGAPAATVQVLIDLITGHATEKGKKKLKKSLKRPVICICNDLFSPSLKELKKHALILHFSPITVASLSERLHEISLKEKLSLDDATIMSLCDKSECDIRSCLSTLQFLKKTKCDPTKTKELFAQIGVKDKSKGIFAVWTDIFAIPEEKKKSYEVEDKSKPENRFKNILKVVQNHGEYEKLMSGVFENYLNTKFKDCYFESILDGLSWATWFQELHATIDHSQNYDLYGYLPLYFVKCHFLYAHRNFMKLAYPASQFHAKETQSKAVLQSFLADVTPAIGRFIDPVNAVTDLLPSLQTIIQPGTIRPVPTQLWSPRERETLKSVVEIMLAYNLSFVQTKNAETGSYSFVLEPDVSFLTQLKFPDQVQGSKRIFPYAVKQLIAREIETEKMRRSDGNQQDPGQKPQSKKRPSPSAEDKEEEFNPFVRPRREPVKVTTTPKVAPTPTPNVSTVSTTSGLTTKDFFGRTVPMSAQATQAVLAQQRRSTGIYYRFKEGYSNAVRRHVKMKDLANGM